MFADYGAMQKSVKAQPMRIYARKGSKQVAYRANTKSKMPPTVNVQKKIVNAKRLAAIKAANQVRAAANKKAAAEKAEINRQNKITALAKLREFKLAQAQKLTERKVRLAQEATNRLKLKQEAADKKRDDIIALKNAGNATAVKTAIDEYNKQLIEIQKANAEALTANNVAQQAQQAQTSTNTEQPQQQASQSSSETPETYTPQQAADEYEDNENNYYDSQDSYTTTQQNAEQYVPNEEGFNVESSQYETTEIPDEDVPNDVNAMSNAYNETPNYEAYSDQYDYADDSGMSGFMDDVKIMYNEKIKNPAGDYLRAKASAYIGQPKTEAVIETNNQTGTIIAGIIAASGLVYVLLRKKRR